MDRRGFLRTMAAGAVGTVVPLKLLPSGETVSMIKSLPYPAALGEYVKYFIAIETQMRNDLMMYGIGGIYVDKDGARTVEIEELQRTMAALGNNGE